VYVTDSLLCLDSCGVCDDRQAITWRPHDLAALVLVTGDGINYCTIKPGDHCSNRIYFNLRRSRDGYLTIYQYCHDEICKQKRQSGQWKIRQSPQTRKFYCLFAPVETMSKFSKDLSMNDDGC
jgi:hypothetical protein